MSRTVFSLSPGMKSRTPGLPSNWGEGGTGESSSLSMSFMESWMDLMDLKLPQQLSSLLFIHLLVAYIIVEMFSSLLTPSPSPTPSPPTSTSTSWKQTLLFYCCCC